LKHFKKYYTHYLGYYQAVKKNILLYCINKNNTEIKKIGRLILLEGLNILGEKDVKLDQIITSPFGKPFFENKAFDFSLSYSNNLVICAIIPKGKIGADTEYLRTIDVHNLNSVFSNNEWELIEESKNPEKEFFNIWTKKEALLKANGIGIAIPLADVEVSKNSIYFNKSLWYFKRIEILPDYIVNLVSNKPLMEVLIIRKFFLDELN